MAVSLNFTEDSLARRFAERHQGTLRYLVSRRRWMLRDGDNWKEDATMATLDRIRAFCREAAAECEPSDSRRLASARTVKAVERLARSDRRLVRP